MNCLLWRRFLPAIVSCEGDTYLPACIVSCGGDTYLQMSFLTLINNFNPTNHNYVSKIIGRMQVIKDRSQKTLQWTMPLDIATLFTSSARSTAKHRPRVYYIRLRTITN